MKTSDRMLSLRFLVRLIRGSIGRGWQAEQSRFLLAEFISQQIYPKYKFSEFGRTFLEDREFLDRYADLQEDGNYHALDRHYTLDQLAKLIVHVPGDTAECGVFKGASSWFICRRLCGLARSHHLFDSFQGLSQPGPYDGSYWKKGDLTATEEKVRANLAEFDFVQYHAGWIPERFSTVSDRKFALVHVDVDLYQPTLDSLGFFYPRLSPFGMIILDDYGFLSCPGARKATDDFMQDKSNRVIELPTGQGLIIALDGCAPGSPWHATGN